jgi:hypothetical protein
LFDAGKLPDGSTAENDGGGIILPSEKDDDKDGVANGLDNCPQVENADQLDSDKDGIGDVCDNCFRVANSDQLDSNGNGKGDECDPSDVQVFPNDDSDGDGVPNTIDLCVWVADPLNKDTDRDGIGDVCDNCRELANVHQTDLNNDGTGDDCAEGYNGGDFTDTDADTIIDASDNCKTVANTDQADQDKDRIGDICDNCPSVANWKQVDSDNNGTGDACEGLYTSPDADDDMDGVDNKFDNCPKVANANQADKDGDKIGDVCDNCIDVANFDQAGPRGSNTGDACKPTAANDDDDGDTIQNGVDNCPNVSNTNQTDTDMDRRGDACDNCPQVANYSQLDANDNDIGDVCDQLILDDDNDTIPNSEDLCPKLNNANNNDTDRDGIGDPCDNCPMHANRSQQDSNNNGVGDVCDTNTLPDGEKCAEGTTQASPLATNLYFLVDQSGSMDRNACSYNATTCSCPSTNRNDCNRDGTSSRYIPSRERAWEDAVAALKAELSNGRYNLGVARFPVPDNDTCSVQPQQSQPMTAGMGTAFADSFESAAGINPSGGTPTPAALLGTLDPDRNGNFSDARFLLGGDAQSAARAKAVVLVTDGLPTLCPGDGQATNDPEMRAATTEARKIAASGTRVFVLGFDIGEDTRFQLLANAGDPTNPGPYYYCAGSASSNLPCICHPTNSNPSGCTSWDSIPKSNWFVVSNTTSIINAVRAIAQSTVSCTLPLTTSGTPDPTIMRVRYVTSDSRTLLTQGTDYSLTGNNITLLGNACTNLRTRVQTDSTARVEVELGCVCSGTTEICGDNRDNDCDGLVDEGCPPPPTTCGMGADPKDCPPVGCTPSAEVCGDMTDNDCDGLIDEGCPPPGCSVGFEVCGNLKDDDCDGLIDEDCPPKCNSAPEICDGVDNDCDGLIDEGCGTICRPFAEICNGLDDNCNGDVDEGCAMCSNPTSEVCDGIDNDCDGMIDEGCPPYLSPG